ncbi:double-stranded DNA-binding domain-containing protein [Ditylenchus destructor]|uniref:Double-stranded DNA-binding domain-containing protein n=1 Tax=Ditylenchus destructor TaxID=166010 RepID=A0AAD4N7M6_9BILA|nr:double-stranded DNA-binding domain-containing protein [Ditylenchus destructor]
MSENSQQQLGQQSAPGQNKQNAEDTARQQEIMKNNVLTQVMDQNALARLNNLAAVKPEKAKAVENMIISMARTGQIREKLTDERLRQLLDQISEKTTKTTTVHFDRRRAAIDSDSD